MMQQIKRLVIAILRGFRIQHSVERSFLIPAYAGLGNFIMATPMVLAIRREFPDAKIYLLSWSSYGTDQVFSAPILDPCVNKNLRKVEGEIIDGMFLLNPSATLLEKIRFFLQLRSYRVETGLILFDACPAFVWWGFALTGCRWIAGHTMDALGFQMGWTRQVMDFAIEVNIEAHETDIHFDLLECYLTQRALMPKGGKLARFYETHVDAGERNLLAAFGLEVGKYIVVQLSAANARFKTPKLWSRSRWATVIAALEARGETVVLPGDENEKSLVDEFVAEYGLQKTVNIAGRTTVKEISTIIKFAKLLLVHDSGLMHIGNAHGTPLIALYGPTDWNFTMPKAPSSRIFHRDLVCQPCMAKMAKDEKQALKECPISVRCMSDISPEMVLAEIEQVLARCHE